MLPWVLGAAALGMIVKALGLQAERRARDRRLLDDLRTLQERVDADKERRAA